MEKKPFNTLGGDVAACRQYCRQASKKRAKIEREAYKVDGRIRHDITQEMSAIWSGGKMWK